MTLKTLGECGSRILSACTPPNLPGDNTLQSLKACEDSAAEFRRGYRECAEILDSEDRCACVTNNITKIRTECNITEINDFYENSFSPAFSNCQDGKF